MYRGHEIIAKKEKCLGGWTMTYYSVVRKSDGWELTSGCTEATDRVTTIIKGLKSRIDGYILDPREEDPEVDEARIEYHRNQLKGENHVRSLS